MSDKNRSKDDDGNGGCGGGGGVGGGGGGDDEDGEGRKISEGCSRRGKRVTLFRLRKGKKIMGERRKEKGVYVNSGCWWRRRRRKIPGCFSCLKEPGTLDSSGESPTSDPNSSEFTFDLLRDLIEKNDFYSKECNTHLD